MADPHDDPPLLEAMVLPSAGRQLPDPPDTGGAMEIEEAKESSSCGENGGRSGGGEGGMDVTPPSSDCSVPAADSQDCTPTGPIADKENAAYGRAPPAPFGREDEASPSGLEDGVTPPAPEIVLVAHTDKDANDVTDPHYELVGDDRDGAWSKAIEARDCLSLMNILNAQDLDKASRALLCLKEGEEDRTALHVAAMQGCFRLAKQLIDLVCEKHPYNSEDGWFRFFSRDGTAYDVYISSRSYDLIYGEDGRSGLSAFEMANDIIGHTSISRYIHHVCTKNSEDGKYSEMYEAYEGTEWHTALARRDCRELEVLLERNSRWLLETCGGLSVLDVAILKGDEKLVKQVIGLFWAASDGVPEIFWHEESYFPSKLRWEQIAKRSVSLKSVIERDWFPGVTLRADLHSSGSALELAEKLGSSDEIKGLLQNVAGYARDAEKGVYEDGDQDLLSSLSAAGLLAGNGVGPWPTGDGEPIELEALVSRLPEFRTLLFWARNIEKHWDREWTAEFLVDVDYNFEDRRSLRFSILRLHYACKHPVECMRFLQSVIADTRCQEEFRTLQVDGQGRPPWHTIVDHYNPEDFSFGMWNAYRIKFFDLVSDSRGRSLLERAISKQFLEQESMVSSHIFQYFENDIRSLIMKSFAHEKLRDRSPNNNISMLQRLYLASFLYEDVNVLRLLTSEEEHQNEIKTFLNTVHVGSPRDEVPGSTGLFIAAALGNQTLMREWFKFKCDCMVEDTKGRTALHYAADPNVLEYISLPTSFFCSVDYPKKVDERMNKSKVGGANSSVGQHMNGNPQSNAYVGRKACILMLLQAGVDLSQVDKKKNIPEPGASSNTEFLSWWYDVLAKDSEDKKNSFNQAGNALSVVGTLVAATSYIGPLQPPLNYTHTEHNGYVDTSRSLVRVFMWTNTLAFYLAVASVMFAVVPSLPMPQEGSIDELRRARHTVLSSLFLLLGSIICILVSFAAATAVVVDNGDYYGANDFLLSPSVIGWFFCVIAMVSFFIRVMRLVFFRNPTIRQIYTFSISAFLKKTLKRSGGPVQRTCRSFSAVLKTSGGAVRKSYIGRNYRRMIGLPVLYLLISPVCILELGLIWMIFPMGRGLRRLWKEQVRHQEPERPPANEKEDNTPKGPISKFAQRLRNWVDEDENSTDEYLTDEEEK